MFEQTEIPEVVLFQPKVIGDERGFFMETFRSDLFARSGIAEAFVQDNHSGSQRDIDPLGTHGRARTGRT